MIDWLCKCSPSRSPSLDFGCKVFDLLAMAQCSFCGDRDGELVVGDCREWVVVEVREGHRLGLRDFCES